MAVVQLQDLVSVRDGNGSALVEGLAASPASPAAAALVMPHVPVPANHEDFSAVHFYVCSLVT